MAQLAQGVISHGVFKDVGTLRLLIEEAHHKTKSNSSFRMLSPWGKVRKSEKVNGFGRVLQENRSKSLQIDMPQAWTRGEMPIEVMPEASASSKALEARFIGSFGMEITRFRYAPHGFPKANWPRRSLTGSGLLRVGLPLCGSLATRARAESRVGS